MSLREKNHRATVPDTLLMGLEGAVNVPYVLMGIDPINIRTPR